MTERVPTGGHQETSGVPTEQTGDHVWRFGGTPSKGLNGPIGRIAIDWFGRPPSRTAYSDWLRDSMP